MPVTWPLCIGYGCFENVCKLGETREYVGFIDRLVFVCPSHMENKKKSSKFFFDKPYFEPITYQYQSKQQWSSTDGSRKLWNRIIIELL